MNTSPKPPLGVTVPNVSRYIWIIALIWTAVIASLLTLKSMQTTFAPTGLIWLLGIGGIFIGGRIFKQRVRAHHQTIASLQQAYNQLRQEREMFTNGSAAVFK